MKRIILLYLLLSVLSSCSFFKDKQPELSFAMEYADSNKKELEQVLKHYANDSLKLEAAKFLIRNMPAHFFYQQGREMDSIKHVLTFTDSHHYLDPKHIQKWGNYSYVDLPKIHDVQIITAEYLIENIDLAFEQWHKRPWGKYLSFHDFCEYLLPYRVGNEPLENWRKLYSATFSPLLDSIYTGSDVLEAANLVRNILKEPQFRHCTAFSLPNLGALYLIDNRFGNCRDFADLFTYVCRSIGIPCMEETNVRHYHTWNVIKDTTGMDIPFWYDTWTTFRGDTRIGDFRCGKIYRKMYALQIEEARKYVAKKRKLLYPYYKNAYLKDVSAAYYKDTLSINLKKKEKGSFVYLSFFDSRQWWSCGVTISQNGVIQFNNVESNMMYAFHEYERQGYRQISYPFLFNKGKIEIFKPDTMRSKQVKLYRKYPHSDWSRYYLRQVKGASFEGSNQVDFNNKEVLFRITEESPIAYNSILLPKPVKYQYIRYQASTKQIIDLSGINLYNQGTPVHPKLISGCEPESIKPISKLQSIIDNDPLTYFTAQNPGGQVTLDLGKPKTIDQIVFFSHNDDNYIRPGDLYELFYNDGPNGWISLGRQIADTVYLEYRVPDHAYLWLRNHTRGHEEQAFYIKDRKQIFPISPWW